MALTKVQQGMSDTLVSGTAVTASGTSVDFTGIPAGVKRITVMFSGVSTNGTSAYLLQIGAGSVTTSGYVGGAQQIAGAPSLTALSSGFMVVQAVSAASTYSGQAVIHNITSNTWTANGIVGRNDGVALLFGGVLALGGTLDRIRITTVNGTDVFDAGTINIMYE